MEIEKIYVTQDDGAEVDPMIYDTANATPMRLWPGK